jgi:hypothetical protein
MIIIDDNGSAHLFCFHQRKISRHGNTYEQLQNDHSKATIIVMVASSTQRRISMLVYHYLAIIIWSALLSSTNGFSISNTAAATACRANINDASLLRNHHTIKPRSGTSSIITLLHLTSNNNDNEDSSSTQNKKTKGDSIRSKTGIRPSLHPTEINCIAEALMLRSSNTQEVDIDIANTTTEPLQVAITAGSIAMNAIDKRNSDKDDTSEKFTMEESQTISGRVVGVVMRMRELEELLVQKVKGVGWVKRYGEEESFGVLKSECKEDDGASNNNKNNNKEELEKKVAETIKLNPLFRMNRAECLLCLFLDTVEKPKLQMLGEDVAGGSEVDFIDADRLEVLRTDCE